MIDTSAVVALLRGEPEATRIAELIDTDPDCRISAGTWIELGVVVDAAGDPTASRQLDRLLEEQSIRIEPVTETQARIARSAYRDFGRGSGHPARLNFGDCFAYALARDFGWPLLFKGNDFSETDLEPAITDFDSG